jgi:GT2 family glycosyltransferase
MNQALVSVVILNYRRRASLIRTLESALAQAYPEKEVIVVDNGSGDGTAEWLAREFPHVPVIALQENLGCAGRNSGVKRASGKLVVTIDNDVGFDSPFELQKVVNGFEQLPEVSALVFKVLEGDTGRVHLRDWCHPRSYWEFADREFETSFIPEGACAFRRDHFLRLGGYYEPFWIGHEGWDLSLRMLNAGLKMVYRPEIRVRHFMSAETRANGRNYYLYTRNCVWLAFKDCAGWWRWKYLAYHIAMMAWLSLRGRHLREFLQGLREGVRGLRSLERTPVCRQGWQRLKAIETYRPGLMARFKKHRERPLI